MSKRTEYTHTQLTTDNGLGVLFFDVFLFFSLALTLGLDIFRQSYCCIFRFYRTGRTFHRHFSSLTWLLVVVGHVFSLFIRLGWWGA